ncbi:energy-coupling factor ABC transporter ATP-binding protein [Aeromicrobium wangtongii]|uniref:energy-coupling factor ABC transporter ATP-binding protein n=1 Tax=Aeromicrobium wangtongii TaxID=2969247 RepID=UPI002017FA23|nr:ATP-binding cassette domain-containing protein [Aeromicrobium wangtongii]MCL3817668.1 ATP-binding cassette domain-containing protein [Aeromicrobium wangtongii]
MTPAALEVRGLHFRYPDGHRALSGIDLSIAVGERTALLGPNGAGKTSLVLHLNGILTADSGSVSVAGLDLQKGTVQEIRRRVAIVFQDPDDQLFMPTVRADVAFGPANLGLRGDELDARVEEALSAVDMLDVADQTPHHLSLGQRRRVAVATVLAMRPEILVLDEPSANMDPFSRRELAEIILGLEVTVLMVTHDLSYALELCPRSLVMNEGRIVADGRTPDILSDDDLLRRNRLELPYGLDPHVGLPRR